jgi:hypothetical protein
LSSGCFFRVFQTIGCAFPLASAIASANCKQSVANKIKKYYDYSKTVFIDAPNKIATHSKHNGVLINGKHDRILNIIFGFSFHRKTALRHLLLAYFRIMNWIYCYSFYYYFNVLRQGPSANAGRMIRLQ